MFNKVLQFVNKSKMLNKNDHIIIGLSGGADSVALLCFFLDIKERYELSLTAVHINHGLRGRESEEDENFVRELCQKFNVPLDVYQYKIDEEAKRLKLTQEEAGRQIRYQCFNETLEKERANKIAVAHNMNDNAETLMMRLFRGTGMKGLEGIPAARDHIIRPFIRTSRAEIEKYCEENQIRYRTDSTNLERLYTRNKIRLDLIPYIEKEINIKLVENLQRMSTLIGEENEYLNVLAEEAYKKCVIPENDGAEDDRSQRIILDIKELRKYPVILIRRIIRIGFSRVSSMVSSKSGQELKDISFEHVNEIIMLLDKNTGKSVDLPYELRVKTEYDSLYMYKKRVEAEGFCYELTCNHIVYIQEIQKYLSVSFEKKDIKHYNGCTKIFCYDKINHALQLKVRSRNQGDKIFMDHVGGHKKIKDYFIDQKIPRDKRNKIPLLANGSEILWIMDEKGITSDSYKSNDDDEKKLYVQLWTGRCCNPQQLHACTTEAIRSERSPQTNHLCN